MSASDGPLLIFAGAGAGAGSGKIRMLTDLRAFGGVEGPLQCSRDHPAHAATRRATRVSTGTALLWRQDAWQAAGEGLIPVADALLLSAQIDPPSAA